MAKGDYYRVSAAAKLVRLHPQTLRKYEREGKVQCEYNPAGQRVFTLKQLASLRPALLVSQEAKTAFYIRASDGNTALLDAQKTLLVSEYGEPDYLIRDKASGLNEKRPGLKRLLDLAQKRKINRVCVTEQDRLTRFGCTYLERLLQEYDVELIVLGNSKTKSPHEELIEDFLALLASFSGKYYRLRGHQQKKDFLDKARETLHA